MSDQYTTVTHTGYFGNLANSFVGALFGIGLFLASFFVLWINEGRVNLATIAQNSLPTAAANLTPELEGKLVAATGKLSSPETLGDTFIRAGDYLMLQRVVEMYAWEEQRHTTTTSNSDGSKTTKTTYTYSKEWTDDPESSDSFRHAAGHTNPPMSTTGAVWKVDRAKLDAYRVALADLALPEAQPIALDQANIDVAEPWRLENGYLINRADALKEPRIGDLRISYKMVPNQLTVTLFGQVHGDQLVPFVTEGATLYRAFESTREQAIETLNTEYTIMLWLLRLGGFLMMWIGMYAAFGPVNAVLTVIPIVGTLSRFLLGTVLMIVALVLSITTIVISILAHQPLLLVAVLVLLLGGLVAWARLRPGHPPQPIVA